MQDKIHKFADAVCTSFKSGAFKNVVIHSPSDKSSETLKIKAVQKTIGGKNVLQFESFLTEGRVTHENVTYDALKAYIVNKLSSFRRADLTTQMGSAALMISKKGDRATFTTHGKLYEADPSVKNTEGNNREKSRILKGDEIFLRELGVSDVNGRVKDKMQSKFRQINRFCEYISEAVNKICPKDEICVADLCCGKSYLSFAAYHTLSVVFDLKTTMYCVDLKKSVIDHCADVAARCDYGGMKFYCGDINEFTPEKAPDMVISLHACDVATDIVLECAIRNKAKVILSTPCCHHELNEKLNSPMLDFIGSRPLLRQKLCSAATDALRLMRLEAAGYETDATELIDPEDTPKNIMLRAYKKKVFSREAAETAFKKYAESYRFMFGYDPKTLPKD
ncbi:MAG: SAM-dependent methyltransferase [Clostridia bacterium]|nr:SAM-dependent methyltransferase [Clostridia bacterium]